MLTFLSIHNRHIENVLNTSTVPFHGAWYFQSNNTVDASVVDSNKIKIVYLFVVVIVGFSVGIGSRSKRSLSPRGYI